MPRAHARALAVHVQTDKNQGSKLIPADGTEAATKILDLGTSRRQLYCKAISTSRAGGSGLAVVFCSAK